MPGNEKFCIIFTAQLSILFGGVMTPPYTNVRLVTAFKQRVKLSIDCWYTTVPSLPLEGKVARLRRDG